MHLALVSIKLLTDRGELLQSRKSFYKNYLLCEYMQ